MFNESREVTEGQAIFKSILEYYDGKRRQFQQQFVPTEIAQKWEREYRRLQNIEGDLNTSKRGIEDYEEVLKQHAKSLEQDKVDAQIHKWSGRTPIEKLLLAQGMGINRKKNQSANFKNIVIACLLESMSIDDRRTEVFEHHRFGELNAQTQQVIEKTEVKIALAQLTSIKKPIKKLLYIQGSGFHFKKNILHHLISDFSAAELKRVVKHRKWESLSILMVMLSVFLMALFALTLSEIAYNRQRDENFFRFRWAELKHRLGYGDNAYDYYHRANAVHSANRYFSLSKNKEMAEALIQQASESSSTTTSSISFTSEPVVAIDSFPPKPSSFEQQQQQGEGMIRDARLQFLKTILQKIKQHAEDMGFDGTMQVSVIEMEPQTDEQFSPFGGKHLNQQHQIPKGQSFHPYYPTFSLTCRLKVAATTSSNKHPSPTRSWTDSASTTSQPSCKTTSNPGNIIGVLPVGSNLRTILEHKNKRLRTAPRNHFFILR
uniref:Uncharacterized protein n=1 Tax=Ditylenchus dipsaci TaxID=166011 RepID=A0A915CRV8_9BILA